MRGVGTFSVDLTVAWQWRENDTVGHINVELNLLVCLEMENDSVRHIIVELTLLVCLFSGE